MKRVVFLTAVTMLLASAGGCQCCRGLWRGSPCSNGVQAAVVEQPCMPAAPCEPCGPGPISIAPGPTTLAPGPSATYVPGPAN